MKLNNESNEPITIYEGIILSLKSQQTNQDSENELIQLQLQYFYNILNRHVRLMFINDVVNYIKKIREENLINIDTLEKYMKILLLNRWKEIFVKILIMIIRLIS